MLNALKFLDLHRRTLGLRGALNCCDAKQFVTIDDLLNEKTTSLINFSITYP
jgi:hypothetical protein